jgi:alpha-L-rhamnosidase
LIRALAGVEPLADAPGYKVISVKPSFLPGLNRIAYDFDSPRGWIKVKWERSGAEIVLDVTVPPGTTARVSLPDGVKEQGGGTRQYRFKS